MIFGPLNLTESGSPIIDLEFAKSNQEKFTLHSLGSPMIMEGLMEESPISRDVCFLKRANHPAAKIRDAQSCPGQSRKREQPHLNMCWQVQLKRVTNQRS